MTTAITGATLIDVENGDAVENTLVLIEGTHITYAGKPDQATIPNDAHIIDAHGKWLIPGLTDMHVHLNLYQYKHTDIYLKFGITTIRDVGGDITMLRLLNSDIEAGRVHGPRLFYTGNFADGNPPIWRTTFTVIVDTPEQAESYVNFMADQGATAIKVYNSLTEANLIHIIAAARRRQLPVVGHIPRCITLTRAVELGMEGLEHIRITARELLPPEEAAEIDYLPVGTREPRLWGRVDLEGDEMTRIIQLLATSPVYLDPTLIADEALYVYGMASMKTHPNNAILPGEVFARLSSDPIPPIMEVPEDLKATAVDCFNKRLQFVGMCHRAGVRILAGTDAPGLGTMVSGLALHRELELLCRSGLSPLDALRAATITAAGALRQEHNLGSVASGKLADLILLDADPLVDIRNTRRIFLVMRGGQVVWSRDDKNFR